MSRIVGITGHATESPVARGTVKSGGGIRFQALGRGERKERHGSGGIQKVAFVLEISAEF